MNRNILIGRFIILSFAIILLISACAQDPRTTNTSGVSPQQIISNIIDLEATCEGLGGIWVDEFEECEGISEEDCKELNGLFNECASACRNIPSAQICTLQCVPVCSFK